MSNEGPLLAQCILSRKYVRASKWPTNCFRAIPISDTMARRSSRSTEDNVPEEGVFPFVDHDKLSFLLSGLSLAFATGDIAATAH